MLAATFGLLLGFPVLRLRGDYLAIVTLGFGEIDPHRAAQLVVDFTGGPNGIGDIPRPDLLRLRRSTATPPDGQDDLRAAASGIDYSTAASA